MRGAVGLISKIITNVKKSSSVAHSLIGKQNDDMKRDKERKQNR